VTVIKIECAWCLVPLDEKDGEGQEGVSHSMCGECAAKLERGEWEKCPFTTKPVIKYLGRYITPDLISCPTCGRCDVGDHFFELAQRVEEALQKVRRPLTVAVMGCAVNGPGEAKHADIGIAFGKGRGALFKKGEMMRSMPWDECIPALLEEIERTW